MPATPSNCCRFVFVAAHPLSNTTDTTQPLQVPQFASARAWEQQRVHLPSEKPPHVAGYHDSSLQVSFACFVADRCSSWTVGLIVGRKDKRPFSCTCEVALSFKLFLYIIFLICVFCLYRMLVSIGESFGVRASSACFVAY